MKKYEEPKLKLHQLKTGKLMAASLRETDTNNANGKPGGVEDFEEENKIW